MGRTVKDSSAKENKVLHDLYYDTKNPSALGGRRQLFLSQKRLRKGLSTGDVKSWVSGQDTYTLHKPVRRKFNRRRTIVSGLNDQFQADLVEMQDFKKENKQFAYILTVIDVFSKFAWAIPLKTKKGKDVAMALSQVLEESSCRALQTDKGKEFYNSEVQTLLKKHSVHHFSTNNEDIKASIIERWNRTLKTKLYRWFTASNSNSWAKVLSEIVNAYNMTIHRSTGIAPANVDTSNQEDVWLKLYASKPLTHQKNTRLLEVDDHVRISKHKFVFAKGYTKNWSSETFRITKVLQTHPITYRLVDQMDAAIEGSFYFEELQKVMPQRTYSVEKVIRTKQVGKQKKYFVKWKGYGTKHNSWVDENDLIG